MLTQSFQDLMSSFTKATTGTSKLNFQYCDYLNISICDITENEQSVVVNVYNPIARPVSVYVRIPVNSRSYNITGPDGKDIEGQIVTTTLETARLRKSVSAGHSMYELIFQASAPAIGYSNYFIHKTSATKSRKKVFKSKVRRAREAETFIENDVLRLDFSPDTGRLVRMSRKDKDLTLDVDQQFFWYNGSQGNSESRQTSGAYIFRPNRTEPYSLTKGNKATIEIVKGPLVQEVRQTFGPFVSQIIRLYQQENYAEFEYTVGPIPIGDKLGKEIITRFDTKIQSNGKFYTDANGREMKERIRNHRDTWKLNVSEPVSGNYYPVNSRIFINDTKSQLTILNDRSQGGSSIKDGQVEVMLHRRLLVDDFLGVGEALNETGVLGTGLVTRGKHRVLLTTPEEGNLMHRHQGELMMLQPWLRLVI